MLLLNLLIKENKKKVSFLNINVAVVFESTIEAIDQLCEC